MAPFRFIDRPEVLAAGQGKSRPVRLVTPMELEGKELDPQLRRWAESAGFKAAEGTLLLQPDSEGGVAGALFGLGKDGHPFAAGKLAAVLPEGDWKVEPTDEPDRHALAIALGAYRFDRYRKPASRKVRVAPPEGADFGTVTRIAAGVDLARDLINTPANDMGPAALEKAARVLAGHYKAKVKVIEGEELLKKNFPLIHAVGRAASQAPRLIDMRWGRKGAPKITLVGKGVCFDTGGLDIKPAAGMLLMKKDMGGAANVLGLALMIMDAGLAVDLRVLIPAVENAIAGNAFRPGDILPSRKGLSVQIDNTDAEGRLVLADALAYASEDEPGLIVDMATLTGAARVALGPDLPPFYTDDGGFAAALSSAAAVAYDPLWQMPLYAPYDKMLETPQADLTNAPSGGFAGSITAALFLKHFVGADIPWCHLDIFGWTPKAQPHAPVGGQAQGIRALYRLLAGRHPA